MVHANILYLEQCFLKIRCTIFIDGFPSPSLLPRGREREGETERQRSKEKEREERKRRENERGVKKFTRTNVCTSEERCSNRVLTIFLNRNENYHRDLDRDPAVICQLEYREYIWRLVSRLPIVARNVSISLSTRDDSVDDTSHGIIGVCGREETARLFGQI